MDEQLNQAAGAPDGNEPAGSVPAQTRPPAAEEPADLTPVGDPVGDSAGGEGQDGADGQNMLEEMNSSEEGGEAAAPEEKEEKHPKRKLFIRFLGAMACIGLFVGLSIIILLTESEGKVIGAVVYCVAMAFIAYLFFVLPPDEETLNKRIKKKEDRKTKNRRGKVLGIAGDVIKIICILGVAFGGLWAIFLSNTFGDVIAISFLFVGMMLYFVTFTNVE